MSIREEIEKLELQRGISSAKQLQNVVERARKAEIDGYIKTPPKHKVRRTNYTRSKIKRDFPGAWLYAEKVIPRNWVVAPNMREDTRLEVANELIHWHRQNGTLDTLKSTYRGDFYNPEPGSPEEKVYWGDFYDVSSYEGVMRQERALRELRREFASAEKTLEMHDAWLEKTYQVAKGQRKRWNKRLEEINELTQELVERLGMIMPSSMFPKMFTKDDIELLGGNKYLESAQRAIAKVDESEADDRAFEDWKQSILDTQSFDEVREIIRDRDRLVALNYQRADILRKIDGWEEKQAEEEVVQMENIMDATKHRDEIADQITELMERRATRNDDIKGLLKLRSALAHNSADVDEQIDKHKHVLSFYDGTPFEAMIARRQEEKTKQVSAKANIEVSAEASATVFKKTKGTLYEGTITVPPKSTVEVDLDQLIEENDTAQNTKEITFRTDALRNTVSLEREKERERQTKNTQMLRQIATLLPEEMLNAHKGLPRNAGPALKHDMEKLPEKNIAVAKNRLCIAPPKYVGDRALEHCRRHIALRTGRWLPFDFIIDVVAHYNRNNYVCQVVTHEYNLPCVLSLGIDRKGKFAGKLRVRTGFFLRPDLWTLEFEAEHCNVDLDDEDNYPVPSLIEEHHRMVGLLDLPEDVSRLLNYGNLKAA